MYDNIPGHAARRSWPFPVLQYICQSLYGLSPWYMHNADHLCSAIEAARIASHVCSVTRKEDGMV